MQRFTFLILLAWLLPGAVIGNVLKYEYTDNCSAAYRAFMSLHFDEGAVTLAKEERANPDNLMAVFLSDYEDYALLMINCDKAEFSRRKPNLDKRINLLEKGDKTSPWYRFCKSAVYMHWAMINVRFGEQFSAAVLFRKSFNIIKDNVKAFPNFEYNEIFTGLQESVVGSLPENYRWLASLLGLNGNLKKGAEKLSQFVATHTDNQPLRAETNIYLMYIRFYLLGQQRAVWSELQNPSFTTKDNLMHVFVKAYLAQDYHKSEEVLKTLQEAKQNAHFDNFPYLYYQLAVASWCNLDSNCVNYFQTYLLANKSDYNIKDSWYKMACYWYCNGSEPKAEYCRKQIKIEGKTLIDADKIAQKFGDGTTWPDKRLLEAKMLIDGGYALKAFNILYTKQPASLSNPVDKAEYFFRLGQVYAESNDNPKALEYFDFTIQAAKGRHEQFGARAALLKGKIYEATGRKPEAIASYKQTLAMPSHDFQNSIDQQAKAGIDRLEEK
jgi:predicted negative regulator of RcsB-dependent stress response